MGCHEMAGWEPTERIMIIGHGQTRIRDSQTATRRDLHAKNSSPWLDSRPGTQRKDSISGVDIKNSDQNGPEGQFITANTTMCNAGFPLYGEGNMISPQLIKVSMKKKKKEKSETGRGGENI